jgi:hypothetical protein
MVVTPGDAIRLSDNDKKVLYTLQRGIDQTLLDEFGCRSLSVLYYRHGTSAPDCVVEEIRRMYSAAGWNVGYTMKNNGPLFTFSPKL